MAVRDVGFLLQGQKRLNLTLICDPRVRIGFCLKRGSLDRNLLLGDRHVVNKVKENAIVIVLMGTSFHVSISSRHSPQLYLSMRGSGMTASVEYLWQFHMVLYNFGFGFW